MSELMMVLLECPAYAPFFGFMGVTSAIIFANLGAAYGTAKAGVGVAQMGILHPNVVMKNIIPCIMSGILGIYGLIVSVILTTRIVTLDNNYSGFNGFAHFGSGIAVGISCLAAGMAIGIVGDAGVRASAQQPKLYVGMILILIFGEALALYGLIVAIIMGVGSYPGC